MTAPDIGAAARKFRTQLARLGRAGILKQGNGIQKSHLADAQFSVSVQPRSRLRIHSTHI
jgi:hypothetical protein